MLDAGYWIPELTGIRRKAQVARFKADETGFISFSRFFLDPELTLGLPAQVNGRNRYECPHPRDRVVYI